MKLKSLHYSEHDWGDLALDDYLLGKLILEPTGLAFRLCFFDALHVIGSVDKPGRLKPVHVMQL